MKNKIINIDYADADTFKGFIESDQFSNEELNALGYHCGNADPDGRVFHIKCYGHYETSCNYDHEVYFDNEPTFYVVNELSGKTIELDNDSIDFGYFEQTVINDFGPDIWQNWYEGLADAAEYSMVDR